MATVMVVDDTQIIRETVAKVLRREGFDTVCASNGREALEAMENAPADLMLLDLMMPEMDGITTLQLLRNHPVWRSTPVIMMTAVSDEAYSARAFELGAVDYLVKAQFTVGQMIERIRRHMRDSTHLAHMKHASPVGASLHA